jgi:hypothetical protein
MAGGLAGVVIRLLALAWIRCRSGLETWPRADAVRGFAVLGGGHAVASPGVHAKVGEGAAALVTHQALACLVEDAVPAVAVALAELYLWPLPIGLGHAATGRSDSGGIACVTARCSPGVPIRVPVPSARSCLNAAI